MTLSFNLSTREAKGGRSLNLRPSWSTEWVPGQPGYTEKPCLKTERKEEINLYWDTGTHNIHKSYNDMLIIENQIYNYRITINMTPNKLLRQEIWLWTKMKSEIELAHISLMATYKMLPFGPEKNWCPLGHQTLLPPLGTDKQTVVSIMTDRLSYITRRKPWVMSRRDHMWKWHRLASFFY